MSADDKLAANKALVRDFCQTFYNAKDFDRARAMLTEDFVNNRPGVEPGPDGTIKSFREQIADPLPQFSMEIRQAVAEDDRVWTYSLIRLTPDRVRAIAVDFWRIADGRIAEHWDVGQAVPDGMEPEGIL